MEPERYIQEFCRIQHAVEAGKNIIELNGNSSCLHDYLRSYYQSHIYHWDVYINMDIDDIPEEPFPEELTQALEIRRSEVLKHLNWFFENGADPNCGNNEYPLMRAVGNLDAPMTEYLIQHGANPLNDGEEVVTGTAFANRN